jgi:serine protease Do
MRRLKRRLLTGSKTAGIGAALGAAVIFAGAAGTRASGETATPPPLAAPGGPPGSFSAIVEQVAPAVVSIDVEMKQPQPSLARFGRPAAPFADPRLAPFGDLRRFFGEQAKPRPTRATGSGFFISPDGYLLTNNHVVEDASKITVRTHDGRSLDAKIVGRDPETDLAVIKVEGHDFPFVDPSRRGEPRVGDWVVAVGSPFNLGGTATAGIVSALVRPRVSGSSYVDYMQIDAAINRGNSGGPTFDTKGRLVGVNTAIFSPTGGSVGIGFDIPAELAASVAKQLIADGEVTRGYIGATIQNVTRDIAESLGRDSATGALVAEIVPGGPAERSGLRPGDLITSLEGKPVASATDLTRRVAAAQPGDALRLDVRRNGAKLDLIIRAGERPSKTVLAEGGAPATTAGFGLAVEPNSGGGLRVTGVAPNSDARAKGVRPGDVIEQVGGRQVNTPEDLAQALASARSAGRDNVLVMVSRDGRRTFLPLDVASGQG